jgi:hypothetical protein
VRAVRYLWPALAAGLLAVAACTSSTTVIPGSTRIVTHDSTVTSTLPPPKQTFTPPRPTFRKPLPPGAPTPPGEKDHECPYIKTGLNVDDGTGVNLADLEGDRVYRRTILTRYHPVGCRFYFYAPPYMPEAEIQPHQFKTAHEAFDAMILTAHTGHNLITEKNFVPGVDGICFQTKFYSGDGNRDWAFVFAKGRTMVIVYAFQDNTSRNALYIARAIARKF